MYILFSEHKVWREKNTEAAKHRYNRLASKKPSFFPSAKKAEWFLLKNSRAALPVQNQIASRTQLPAGCNNVTSKENDPSKREQRKCQLNMWKSVCCQSKLTSLNTFSKVKICSLLRLTPQQQQQQTVQSETAQEETGSDERWIFHDSAVRKDGWITYLQCLWGPLSVSMTKHSPPFRQYARSFSWQGLKCSECSGGTVGDAARDRQRPSLLWNLIFFSVIWLNDLI